MSRRKRGRKSVGSAGAAASGPADGGREPGRFSARRKTETILRLLRGESLDSLARELGVTAATLAQWREAFLTGGQAALKSRLADERDDEIERLRAKVGEITNSSVEELPIGSFVPSVFQDNGNTGDRVGFLITGPFDEFTPCLDFVADLDFILATDADVFTLTHGNITITP